MNINHHPPLRMPVYRGLDGKAHQIAGKHADNWPYPKQIEIDGTWYVEQPLPSETGWGLTFHAVNAPRRRTPFGRFLAHYWEGRSSGFPIVPTAWWSARWAADWMWRRLAFRRTQIVAAMARWAR